MELQIIKQRIYTIRGQKVMLDFDLAELYEVLTRRLNEQVKRNSNRFPEEFMFQLTEAEWESMWSQFATTSSRNRRKGYLPYAFTEHGVAMLASVLKSEKAIEMNIAIVKAFISLRQVISFHYDLAGQLNELRDRLGEHDTQLAAIYDTIENLLDKKVEEEVRQDAFKNRERIGFKKNNEKENC